MGVDGPPHLRLGVAGGDVVQPLAVVVLGWYLVYTEILVREMRRDAVVHTRLYLEIIRGLNDRSEGAAEQTLLSLIDQIQNLGIPIIVADPDGFPAYTSNLPFVADPNDPQDQRRVYEDMVELVTFRDKLQRRAEEG